MLELLGIVAVLLLGGRLLDDGVAAMDELLGLLELLNLELLGGLLELLSLLELLGGLLEDDGVAAMELLLGLLELLSLLELLEDDGIIALNPAASC